MARPYSHLATATITLLLAAAAGAIEVRAEQGEQGLQVKQGSGPVSLFQRSQAAMPGVQEVQPYRSPASRPAAAVPLGRQEQIIRRVQSALAQLGYDLGEPDGKLGPRTRVAIRDFQEDRGERTDGRVTQRLLSQIAAAFTEARAAQRREAAAPAPSASEPDGPAEIMGDPPTSEREAAQAADRSSITLIAPAQAASGGPEMPVPDDRADYSVGAAAKELWLITSSLSGYLAEMVGQQVVDAVE